MFLNCLVTPKTGYVSPRVQGDTKLLTTFVAGHMIEDDGFSETIIARKSNGFAELTKNEQYIPPHRPGKVQTNHTSWLVAE